MCLGNARLKVVGADAGCRELGARDVLYALATMEKKSTVFFS
jgi:hypothetical protein